MSFGNSFFFNRLHAINITTFKYVGISIKTFDLSRLFFGTGLTENKVVLLNPADIVALLPRDSAHRFFFLRWKCGVLDIFSQLIV